MQQNNELIKLTVFFPIDGLRTPHTLTLDKFRNIVSFEVDRNELERIKSNDMLLRRHQVEQSNTENVANFAQTVINNQPGGQQLYRHVTDNGIRLSREPLDDWALDFEKWMVKENENPFANTDDIREDYFKAETDVAQRIAAGTCPGCEMNRTKVEYRVKLRERLGLT